MRKPKDRLPGLRMIASRPPRPVPSPAIKLSRKALIIEPILSLLYTRLADMLATSA
jgi:hypothetical protein